jgi:hypothetical protein
MATMTETLPAIDTETPTHEYHATAHVLSGKLERPIEQEIEEQAPVKLSDRRGGHLTRSEEDVSIEGLITYAKGHTRVSGSRSLKHKGWVTISTSIMEGLNVFEIITADRVVSQVSTDHAYKDGHFPRVTFLGTQFNNLQVSGFRVKLKVNLDICGKEPPADNKSYLQDSAFLGAVREQTEKIANAAGLPKELKAKYDKKLIYVDELIKACQTPNPDVHKPITCSLVKSIGKIPIRGVESFGHILVIPEFGTVTLGEVEVGEKLYDKDKKPCVYFKLTGVEMNLGCVGQGNASAASSTANGRHYP